MEMKKCKLLLLIIGLAVLLPVRSFAQDLRYVDAAALTVINKSQEDDKPFQRLDVDKYPELSAVVNEFYRQSTGLAVVFRTDSRIIRARWTTVATSIWANTTLVAQRGLDLYILRDGKWVHAGVGMPSTTKMEHEAAVVENMDGTMHDCLLYLPMKSELVSLELGIDEGAVIEPIPNPFSRKIVVIGSSITHGASASRSGLLYPAIWERNMGLQFTNLGTSGVCKLEHFFAQVAAETEADAFIIDLSNPNAEQIRERMGPFVKVIREAHPHTPLIFLQAEVFEKGNFNVEMCENEGKNRAAAVEMLRKVMSEDEDVYFLNPGIYVGEDHEGTADGTHPNDLGFYRMVNQVEPQLRVIFEQYGIEP